VLWSWHCLALAHGAIAPNPAAYTATTLLDVTCWLGHASAGLKVQDTLTSAHNRIKVCNVPPRLAERQHTLIISILSVTLSKCRLVSDWVCYFLAVVEAAAAGSGVRLVGIVCTYIGTMTAEDG
jgi:hypothetical protein